MKIRGLFAVLAAVLGLATWGGVHAGERPTFFVKIEKGRFVPDTLEVPAHQKFDLVITNAGNTSEEFESIDLNREKSIAPGKSATLVLGPLAPRTYQFFQDHRGTFTAKGQLVVKEELQK